EARLPDARLADDGHHLALARARLPESPVEEGELGQATDERARIARSNRGADQPVDLARQPDGGLGRRELEAARQEPSLLGAHEGHSGARPSGELIQELPSATLRIRVNLE